MRPDSSASLGPALPFGVLAIVAASAAAYGVGGWGGAGLGLVVLGLGLAAASLARQLAAERVRTERLARLAQDLRAGVRPNAETVVARLGEEARPLLELAAEADRARAARDEAARLAETLVHLDAHYTLLLRPDGRVVDANPAFCARSGLDPASLRADPRALARVLPLDRVLELAERSRTERVALSGVPLTLSLPTGQRAAHLAVHTLPGATDPLVVVRLTDRTRERELERQIEGFADALDLMVDQRVAQLTAQRDALETMLETAGLAVFVFDASGALQRLNGAAERLTGRTAFTLRHLGQMADVLFGATPERDRFLAWYARADGAPMTARAVSPRGPSTLTWHAGTERRAGEVVRRLLVGAPLPEADLSERLVALATSLERIDAPLHARAHLETIREAIRRLRQDEAGDGASNRTASAPT